jgi:NADPH:quinone reductase
MKAFIVGPHGPELTDIAEPAPKPGEVLVRVRANAVNRADLEVAAGLMHGARGGRGQVLGFEWSGEVAALGEGVAHLAVNDRVMGSNGGFADFAATPAWQVFRIPSPRMSFEQATCFPVALRTMHNAIVTVGALAPGETVLVQGAGGGLGLMGMQIAREMGAGKVIGTSRDAGRRNRFTEFGADAAVDSSDPAWVQQVLDSTGGAGADLTIDLIGGAMVTPNLAATRVLGRIVNVGRLGGDACQFDTNLHALRRISYTGVTFRSRTPQEVAAVNVAVVTDLWPALKEGRLSMPVDRIFPFEDFSEALARMRANQHFGKIVLQH